MDNKQAALELGQKPVGQLLWQYALPAIVAMTASSLYNIIDRAMIGQIVGPEAIAGLGITFPFMNLSAAFGVKKSSIVIIFWTFPLCFPAKVIKTHQTAK